MGSLVIVLLPFFSDSNSQISLQFNQFKAYKKRSNFLGLPLYDSVLRNLLPRKTNKIQKNGTNLLILLPYIYNKNEIAIIHITE